MNTRGRRFGRLVMELSVPILVLILLNGPSRGQPLAHKRTSPAPAASCLVAPRSPGFFIDLAATPAPAPPAVSLLDAFAASAVRASAEEVAAVQATVDLLVACVNAGDFSRTVSLFTDAYWLREVGGVPGKAEALASAAGATPVPVAGEDRQGPATVLDARLLADGRIAAIVAFGPATPDDSNIDLVAFEKIDNRWLIDEVVTDVARKLGTPLPTA